MAFLLIKALFALGFVHLTVYTLWVTFLACGQLCYQLDNFVSFGQWLLALGNKCGLSATDVSFWQTPLLIICALWFFRKRSEALPLAAGSWTAFRSGLLRFSNCRWVTNAAGRLARGIDFAGVAYNVTVSRCMWQCAVRAAHDADSARHARGGLWRLPDETDVQAKVSEGTAVNL